MRQPIITSYFYLQSATTRDKTIDFTHKSISWQNIILRVYFIIIASVAKTEQDVLRTRQRFIHYILNELKQGISIRSLIMTVGKIGIIQSMYENANTRIGRIVVYLNVVSTG